MSAQATRETGPERELRTRLHGAGLRYRVHVRPLVGLRREADVVFTRRRVAVFVDGCFWHGCPEHATSPKANAEWWARKLERNKERDEETNTLLAQAGWTVIRIWEHENPDDAAAEVIAAVRSRA